MSEYLLLFVIAIALFALASTAAPFLRRLGQLRQGPEPVLRAQLEEALHQLREDLEHTIARSQARADEAIALTQKIVGALGPVSSALGDLKGRLVTLENLELEARREGLKQELSQVAEEVKRLNEALSERDWEGPHRQLEALMRVLEQRVENAESSISRLPGRIDSIVAQLSLVSTLTEDIDELRNRLSKIEATLAAPKGAKQREDRPSGSSLSDPASRGGGSRLPRGPVGIGDPKTQRAPKAALVASRSSGNWQIYVELHDDLGGVQVSQGSVALLNSPSSTNMFGPLADLAAPLSIGRHGDPPVAVPLLSADRPVLYFRYQGEFASEVRHPSRGLFLIIARSDWTYDEERSSPAPIEQENVSIPGFRAHFISAGHDWRIVFFRPGEPDFYAASSSTSYDLEGKQIDDAEDTMGPLFVSAVPTLASKYANRPNEIANVVVGVEGRGLGRWRRQYPFDAENQSWRQGVKDNGSGWYFLRLYDLNNQLIDSFDFRYSLGLKEIRTAQGSSALVRDFVSIDFRHDNGVVVELNDSSPDFAPRKSATPEGTYFTWQSNPHISKVRFTLNEGAQSVPICVSTDRIWWRILRSNAELTPWTATELELQEDDFIGTSETALELHVPGVERAKVGFSRDDCRSVVIGANSEAKLQLHTFSEAKQLRPSGDKVLIFLAETEESEVELRLVVLKRPVTCKWCDFTTANIEQLAEHVAREHHARCFEQLALRGEGRSRALFVCTCGQYYPDSALPDENPIDRLSRHVDRDHLNKTMAYTKISDPEQIRILTGMKDKWVWRCKVGHNCRPIAPTGEDQQSSADKIEHLWQEHSNDLSIDSDTWTAENEARRFGS